MGVTQLEIGNNNVVKNPPKLTLDTPTNNMDFGICRALNHFRAEITVVNKGQYDV